MDFRPVTLKEEHSHFYKKSMTPDMQKNSKMKNIYKIFLGTKQPKKLQNTSLTPFVEFRMDFRPVTLKEEHSHFYKKSMTPDMQKNSKMKNIYKIYFWHETT